MIPKRIAITGGPGTGKSSVVNALKKRELTCYDEISREVTLEARKDGIDQLFLTHPLLFSEKLLEGRTKQFTNVAKETVNMVFLDRGLPDILAYMDYKGDEYPRYFVERCESHRYDYVFILKPWEAIFKSDSERYENFEQAKLIHNHLVNTYTHFGYQLINVPFESIEKRTDFILEVLHLQ